MKRFQHIRLATAPALRLTAPLARPGVSAQPLPGDAMWRSRRVESGSDWMDAWIRKPGRHG